MKKIYSLVILAAFFFGTLFLMSGLDMTSVVATTSGSSSSSITCDWLMSTPSCLGDGWTLMTTNLYSNCPPYYTYESCMYGCANGGCNGNPCTGAFSFDASTGVLTESLWDPVSKMCADFSTSYDWVEIGDDDCPDSFWDPNMVSPSIPDSFDPLECIGDIPKPVYSQPGEGLSLHWMKIHLIGGGTAEVPVYW